MRIKRPMSCFPFIQRWKRWSGKSSAQNAVSRRIILLPREISAGCGLAWRMLPEEFEQWQHKLDPARYDAVAAVEQ